MSIHQKISVSTVVETNVNRIVLNFKDEPDDLDESLVYNNIQNKLKYRDIIRSRYDFERSEMFERISSYEKYEYQLINNDLFYSLIFPQADYGKMYTVKKSKSFILRLEWFLANQEILQTAYSKIMNKIYDDIAVHPLFNQIFSLIESISIKMDSHSNSYQSRISFSKMVSEFETKRSFQISKNMKTSIILNTSNNSNDFGLSINTTGIIESNAKWLYMDGQAKRNVVASMFMFNTYDNIKLWLTEYNLLIT